MYVWCTSGNAMKDPDAPPATTIIPEGGIATANGTAPSSSNNLPASIRPRPRPAKQKQDNLLRLHDPYGPGLTLTDFGDLVRHSLAIGVDFPTPSENQEAGQVPTRREPRSIRRHWWEYIHQLIRLIFSCLQMGLPAIYFHRVALIINKSEISLVDYASIKRRGTNQGMLGMITLAGGVAIPKIKKIHSMQIFKKKWKSFVKRCIEEWRNLNVISTLLLSILLTFLQINEAGLHSFTRLTILLSLECAFLSLLYSVWYVARFHSLRGVERGMNWIFAAAQTSTPPYWNLWLFLALPTVWLAWSLIFFSAGLLSFVWTSGDRRVPELTPFTDDDTTMDFIPMSFSDFTPLWPRIILTVVLAFGFGVGFLVMQAFKDVGANKWDRSKSKKDNSESSSSSEDDVKVHDG